MDATAVAEVAEADAATMNVAMDAATKESCIKS